MAALPSVDETDRLVRAHNKARWVFLSLVGVIGALVCILVFAVLAGDLESRAGSVLAVAGLQVGLVATLAVLGVRLALDVRIDLARLRSELADTQWGLNRLAKRLDGPTEQLRVVASVPPNGTVVDSRARAEVVELTERINRRLSDT